jgi:hypothetical protein
MGYCKPWEWVSHFVYWKLLAKFTPLVQRYEAEEECLVATGTVGPGEVASFEPFYTKTAASTACHGSGEGPYTLELLDAGGSLLFARSFAKVFWDTDGDFWPFHEVVPLLPGTAQVRLLHSGTLLASVYASVNAPEVSVIYPNGGEVLDGVQKVTWTASDADGDALSFDLLYSADGGTTWGALAVDLETNSYHWDTTVSPGGSKSLVKVIALDGVHEGEDRSDGTFAVESKTPEATIFAPADRSTYFLGEPVSLEGYGYDAEDGPLSDETLAWSSDTAGFLGAGRRLVREDLPAGLHAITIDATDSHNNHGQATVTITVLDNRDRDGDRVADAEDNCPLAWNAGQADCDGDGAGDACDPDDDDGDGYPNWGDNCPSTPNDQADADGDGIGDACESGAGLFAYLPLISR